MVKKRSPLGVAAEVLALIVTVLTHWVVFYFIFINACKPRAEAAKLSLVFPTEWALWENLTYVWNYNNHVFLRSFLNSCIITVSTMLVLILGICSMALSELSDGGIVDFDEDRKATMASNLMVVLCGESEAQPVLNTGSLY